MFNDSNTFWICYKEEGRFTPRCLGVTQKFKWTYNDNTVGKPEKFNFVVVDDAHHIFSKTSNEFSETIALLAQNPIESSTICWDTSQAERPSDFTVPISFDLKIQLKEVVRNSKRVFNGYSAFRSESGETIAFMTQKGPKLESRLFKKCSSDTEREQNYIESVLDVFKLFERKFSCLPFHGNTAILVHDTSMLDWLRKGLSQQLKRFRFVDALQGAQSVTTGAVKKDVEDVILDTVDNFDGMERLIIVAVGLDAPRSVSMSMEKCRSQIYRAISRAHLFVAVVQEHIPSGWLEHLMIMRQIGHTNPVSSAETPASPDVLSQLPVDTVDQLEQANIREPARALGRANRTTSQTTVAQIFSDTWAPSDLNIDLLAALQDGFFHPSDCSVSYEKAVIGLEIIPPNLSMAREIKMLWVDAQSIFVEGVKADVPHLLGIPLFLRKKPPKASNRNQNNQIATWLMINPDTGFAPDEWLGGSHIGEVSAVRSDGEPFRLRDLFDLHNYIGRLLDSYGDPASKPTIGKMLSAQAFKFSNRAAIPVYDDVDDNTNSDSDGDIGVPVEVEPVNGFSNFTESRAEKKLYNHLIPTCERSQIFLSDYGNHNAMGALRSVEEYHRKKSARTLFNIKRIQEIHQQLSTLVKFSRENTLGSYGLKHIVEKKTRKYLSNGDLIAAMLLSGHRAHFYGVNCDFHVQIID